MPFGTEQPPARSDDATIAARVEEVVQLRLDGKTFQKIMQYAVMAGWGIRQGMIREYIRRADDLLVERQERNRRRIINLHLARREALYDRALEAADNRTALAVLADLADLQCLYVSQADLKEAAKVQAEQAERIHQLEEQLRVAAQRNATPAPAAESATGPVGPGPDGLCEPVIVPS